MDAEVIRFWRPGRDRTLFVGGLPREVAHEDKWRALEEAFAAYGLLFEVQVMELDGTLPGTTTYGFVKFYSLKAAAKAQAATDRKLQITGRTLKVCFVTSLAPQSDVTVVLYWSKCQELANHYLGFNGWSVAINSLVESPVMSPTGPDDTSSHRVLTTPDDTSSRCVCYQCDVCVRVGETESTGRGEHSFSYSTPQERVSLTGKTKKAAYARACEQAFSKIALAVLDSGKVCAHSIEGGGESAMATDAPPITNIVKPIDQESEELQTNKHIK